jgi:uncharacterized membrane protein
MEDVELIFVAYHGTKRAGEVFEALIDIERENQFSLFNAAVINKDKKGKTRVKEMRDVDAWQGALAGAIFGGLIGLLGGPVGMLVGTAAGGATGSVAARKIDMGFSDKFLNEIKSSIQPSSSALLLIVEEGGVEQLMGVLKPFNGKIVRHTLRSELIKQILESQK